MTDLVPIQEAEARRFARDIIRRAKSEEAEAGFGVKVRWLGDGGSRRFVIETIKHFSRRHPVNLMDAVERARQGSTIADEAMRELILEHANAGTPPPTYLAAYNMEIVSGRIPKRRGKKRADYFLRDMGVLVVLILVMEKFDLAPTSHDGRNTCACTIVSAALGEEGLGIGYKAVEAIWLKYKHCAGAPYDGSAGVLK